ncbi:MAG: hypothetical protein V1495_02810 [Pseudomonadota bacterium]
MYERIFLGEVRFEENRTLRDLNLKEGILLLVPVLLAIWLGLKPGIVLTPIELSVSELGKVVATGSRAP